MPSTLTPTLTPTSFTLEPLENRTFSGYTTGQVWNGWACPLFTHDQAMQIVEAWHGRGFKADFDPAGDVFRFAPIDQQGEPNPNLSDEEVAEHFGPIVVAGQTLYPIGAGAWVWEAE